MSRVREAGALSDLACANAASQHKCLAVEKIAFWVHDVLTSDRHFYPNVTLFHNSIFILDFLRDALTKHLEIEYPSSSDVAPPAA